jgi:hypothetical protein
MDNIEGAKILRERLEGLYGVVPDPEPPQELPDDVLPLYAWTGTTPDPGRATPEVQEKRRRRGFRKHD